MQITVQTTQQCAHGKRNQPLHGARNTIPVNSLGLKIRATSCPSLNPANRAPTPQCLNPYIPPIYRRLLSIILLLKHIYTIRSLPHISEIHSAAPGKRFLIYTALNAAGVDALRASTPAAVKDHFFLQKVKR